MKKRIQSFGYAIKGIRSVFSTEMNMRIHLIIAAMVVLCGFFFNISITEWLIVLLCMGLVFSLEMVNTAIEALVDLASPKKHVLAGKAKDVAAGAVLIAAIFSAVIGLIIFLPKVINFVLYQL